MQAMMMKMLGDMLANLPPDIRQKIETVGQFAAMLDGRLTRIESDLTLIKNHLGIDQQPRLTHERADEHRTASKHGNGAAIGD
jgi:hypothetical protein